MANKSTTNANSIQDTNDGYTVVMANDDGNKNSSIIALKTGQRSLSTKDIDNSFINEQPFLKRIFSWRSFIVALLHLLNAQNMMPVVMIPMSLVCMSGPARRPTHVTLNHSRLPLISNYTEFTPLQNITVPQIKVYEFSWDSETRGLLISAYLFTNFLGPQLSNVMRSYIGNKLTLTISSVFLAFMSFLSPFAARTNVYFFLATRILSGLCTSTNIPITADTLAYWLPAKEKLTSTTIVISGRIVGASLCYVVAGYLCKTGIDNGWPLTFYFHGVIAVVWTIVWHSLSSRKPENHSYISGQEKAYIVACRVGMNHVNTKGADRTPYRTILTSRPVLAFFASIMCYQWAFMVVITCLPRYLTSVLKFELQDAGSVFAVITIIRLPGLFLWSVLGNWLRGRKYMTTNKSRKICYGLGQGLAAVSFFAVSFLDVRHKWLSCVMLCLSLNAITFGTTISTLVPLDMAPRYAGFTSAISSTAGSLAAITAPLTAATITKEGSFEEWRIVWITTALVNLTAGTVFLIFGNASLQSWAVPVTVPTIVKAHDQSSSDLKPSSSAAAGLSSDKL